MTKKQPVIVNQTITELVIPKEEFNKVLDERIAIGNEIFSQRVNTQEAFKANREDFSNWNDYNSEYLKHAFNKEFNEYKKRYDDAGTFSFTILGGGSSPSQELKKFKDKVNYKLDNLKKLRAKSDLLKSNSKNTVAIEAKSIEYDTTQVFIVHGHNEEAKVKTARFVEKIGFKPIILHEQASSGKTIIEKIEEYTNVGFGIVLYTPCDIGAEKTENPEYKNRARQNVVFEHGYLIGKIGRNNVCALVKGDVETPNDISGVVYINMDSEDAWHLKLAKELRNSGYTVDMNKIV